MASEFSKEQIHEARSVAQDPLSFDEKLAQLLPAGFTTDPIVDDLIPAQHGEREFTERERNFLKLLIARGTGNDGWYIDEESETRQSILTEPASILNYNPASRTLLRSVITGLEEDDYVRVKKDGDRPNSPIVNLGLDEKGQKLVEDQLLATAQDHGLDKETIEKKLVNKKDFNIDFSKLDHRFWQIAPVIIRRIQVLNDAITDLKKGYTHERSLRELTSDEIKEKAEAFRELFVEKPNPEGEYVSFLAKITTKHNILQESYRRLAGAQSN